MATPRDADTHPADRAVILLQRTRDLLHECRVVAEQLGTAPSGEGSSAVAERIAYGVLVAALEGGLVKVLEHAMEVLSRFSAPAGVLGGEWLKTQEKRLGRGEQEEAPDADPGDDGAHLD